MAANHAEWLKGLRLRHERGQISEEDYAKALDRESRRSGHTPDEIRFMKTRARDMRELAKNKKKEAEKEAARAKKRASGGFW